MSAFDRLIGQIDAFIRKFYKNQLVKGTLMFIGVLIVSYLAVVTLEYFGHFNTAVRASLFFGFLGVNGYILYKYIINPTLKLRSYGKRIDRYQASKIIGSFFPNVSDRLLNTLQLSDRMDHNSTDFELISASVQQRSVEMNRISFVEAIDLGENKRYLIWVMPVVAVLFALVIISPTFLSQGTERVVNFSNTYVAPAPFNFKLVNTKGQIEEGEDFHFEVQIDGSEFPEKVFIKSDQGRFLLNKTAKNRFSGELAQLRRNTSFHFEANGFNSADYNVEVVGKTAIKKFQASIKYPDYLGKTNEVIENASDMVVPEGTEITWSVLTKNSRETEFWLNSDKKKFSNAGFKLSNKFLEEASGMVILKNDQSKKIDTTEFNIEIIKDEYPSIQVEQVQDSVKDGIRYFSGAVSDDYGLRGVSFFYTITKKSGDTKSERLNVGNVFGTEAPFNFAVDFRREEVQLEDKITYYFVVYDNDGVNGSKSTKSRVFEYKLPTLEELNEQRDNEQEKAKEDLNDALNKVNEFKENLEHLKREIQDSKQSDWNKEQQIQQLQEEHKSLIENLEDIQEELNNSLEEKNQLSELDKELLEKQEMINDLLEELMDDELKNLLEELEKLMKEQNQNAIEENLEKLEMSSEDMKKQLERTMEMLEKTRVNEKIDDLEEELKKLAEEQEELRKDTEDQKNVSEEDKKKQEEINEKFNEIEKDLKEIDSLNNELSSPMELGMEQLEEKSEKVEEDLENSKKQLDKNNGGKASEEQKGASQKMKEMAESLNEMQMAANQQQQQEDINMLRNILESLIILSLDQEDVMQKFKKVREDDPAFRKYGRTQRKIISDTKVVNDSLMALAKRQPKIATFIDKELNAINSNHKLSLEDIDEREKQKLGVHQQYVMTSYNNLALMLNESLEQMQQQMKSMMPGSGSCTKPGGKGMPKAGEGMKPGDMKQMLKDQLEQMKKGNNPGGKEPGKQPGNGKEGQGGMGLGNEQLAKMAAEQGAIRRRLEELRNKMNKDGKGQGNELNPLIQELEEQERDIINKRLDNNLIERQKRILTRLLESEKALMERGFDEKRESKEGKNENNGNQIRFEEYNQEKLKQIELLRSVDPTYKLYYKNRANEYFNKVL